MNIKKTTQNGLIGLVTLVASSCAITKNESEQKLVFDNITYTLEINNSGYIVKS